MFFRVIKRECDCVGLIIWESTNSKVDLPCGGGGDGGGRVCGCMQRVTQLGKIDG